MYNENGSKNRSSGLQDFKVPNKRVTSHATGGERCHVYLLDLYLSKLPVEAFQEDHLYMRPLLAVPPAAYTPWFVKTKLGQNACTRMVKEMAEAAGLKSNHSLRVTTATTLFSKGVPEKLVQERTGHRFLSALRMYERTSAEQEQSVSNLLASRGKKRTFQEEMEVDSPRKKQRVGVESGTYVQNCVLNVYGPSSSIQGVNPSQLNIQASCDGRNSPDYDAPFRDVIP